MSTQEVHDAVVSAMRSGKFDDAIVAVVVSAAREWSGPVTRVGFVIKMAIEMMDRSAPSLPFRQARDMAANALAEFLRNEKIKYGDSHYDWSGAAAVELAHELCVQYWEAKP